MISDTDIKIERFNSGRGGQSQNHHPKNVRATHLPTGIVVIMRGRYFHKNVAMAKKELEYRLSQLAARKTAADKKARRDERIKDTPTIRTYDFTSDRVKDHRTGRTSTIKRVLLKGELDDLLLLG